MVMVVDIANLSSTVVVVADTLGPSDIVVPVVGARDHSDTMVMVVGSPDLSVTAVPSGGRSGPQRHSRPGVGFDPSVYVLARFFFLRKKSEVPMEG